MECLKKTASSYITQKTTVSSSSVTTCYVGVWTTLTYSDRITGAEWTVYHQSLYIRDFIWSLISFNIYLLANIEPIWNIKSGQPSLGGGGLILFYTIVMYILFWHINVKAKLWHVSILWRMRVTIPVQTESTAGFSSLLYTVLLHVTNSLNPTSHHDAMTTVTLLTLVQLLGSESAVLNRNHHLPEQCHGTSHLLLTHPVFH